jgi:hypothetical protein
MNQPVASDKKLVDQRGGSPDKHCPLKVSSDMQSSGHSFWTKRYLVSSNAKTRFQSFFMSTTVQPFAAASVSATSSLPRLDAS